MCSVKQLLLVALAMLFLACSGSYEEEYINILEERIKAQERKIEELNRDSHTNVTITEKDIVEKAYDFIEFNCGSSNFVQEVRTFQNSHTEWDLIVTISSMEFNEYGEPLDRIVRGKALVFGEVVSVNFEIRDELCD